MKAGGETYMVLYEFKHMKRTAETHYIFQTVKDRKLSDIYHAHDFYEWILVLEGSCTQTLNERQMQMEKNTCMLLCPGDRHRFLSQSDDLYVLSLSVEKEEMERFANAFQMTLPDEFCMLMSLHQARAVIEFCRSSCEVDYKVLLSNLMRICVDASKQKNDVPLVLQNAVKDMMQPENLRLGTPRLIELSGYSKSHLSRLMYKYYGTTLHGFVMQARLETAYNLLVLTKINVEELAEQLGYASFSHFNKIFKEKYAITPAALRKKCGVWTA